MTTRLCWLCVVTLTFACSKADKEAIAERETRAEEERAEKEAVDLFARKRHCSEIGESRQKRDEAEASESSAGLPWRTIVARTYYCYSPTLNTCLYRVDEETWARAERLTMTSEVVDLLT